jgi:hypothetical protein
LAQVKACSPACPSFKCVKNSAFVRRDAVWCRWTEEICNVSNCTFALCAKRRMLPRGICGETVKRQTVDRNPEEIMDEPIKLRGKTLRKIGDRELY